ncbi:NADPH:quinone oxidoreductase family protein [Oceanobacillus halophilus]|uniref:NADPH:quinone oxidoreductase family protein n=1 Tax=Oceanobacillus halophilus TaxID=930130 RepID=A0A495A7J0_9BACI|nr:NADPH:quinone oxidoreductase family protein [Oceanobacillus halophilus]RKQ35760.1 NADPH:quinone oxidoreductase family protein [Oceanobacillus halophilus]
MKRWEVVKLGKPEESLRLNKVEIPAIEKNKNEVLIKVESAAMNFFDILQCKGEYQERHPLPFTPGAELSGIVMSEDDTVYKKGQRVLAAPSLPNGAYSEWIKVEGDKVFSIPDTMTFNEAASMFITYQTGYYALLQCAQIKRGETLLVHAGSGGVGSAAIQLGKAFGARVIATAGSEEKIRICKEIGADIVINYKKEDFVKIVKESTNGKGADVIFDPVGGDTFDRSRKCIAFNGRLLIIGFASGRIAKAPANHLLVKNYSAVGVHWGYFWKLYPEKVNENHTKLVELYNEGFIKPLIYNEYSFEQLPLGLKQLGQRETWGKLVLKTS